MPMFTSKVWDQKRLKSQAAVFNTTQIFDLQGWAAGQTTTSGVLSVSLSASIPTHTGYFDQADVRQSFATVGALGSNLYTSLPTVGNPSVTGPRTQNPFETIPNPDCFTPFWRYTYGAVLASKCEVWAIPHTANTIAPTQKPGVSPADTYCTDCISSLSTNLGAEAHGASWVGVSDYFNESTYLRNLRTSNQQTRFSSGGRATASYVSRTYRPRNLYTFKDFLDNIDDFKFATTADVTIPGNPTVTAPTLPVNKAYFTWSLGPAASGVIANEDPSFIDEWNMFPGKIPPHHVVIRLTYKVMYWNPTDVPGWKGDNQVNMPAGAAGAGFAAAAGNTAAAMLVGGIQIARGIKRARMQNMA